MIPNIVKGRGVSGAVAYVLGQGNHPETGKRLPQLAPGEDGRATILGGQNFGFDIKNADDVELARRMMEWNGLPQNQASKTIKLENDCFHASLSWGKGQDPSAAEMTEAAQSFLKSVGLEKAQAIFVSHDDKPDMKHIHIVASRIDPEMGRSLRMDYDKVAAQKWAIQWERDHGQVRDVNKAITALMEGIEKRDAGAVLTYLTRDKGTFQKTDVDRALSYGNLNNDERDKFRAEILTQAIGLRDTAQAPVNRYTTREVLAAEMSLQRSVAHLAGDSGIRLYRGIGQNVGKAQPGEALYFSTEKENASFFGAVHFVDVTPKEFAKFDRSNTVHSADCRTANPEIISRLKPLTPHALAAVTGHGVKAKLIDQASAEFTLKPEQDAALRHLTGREGFAILWGQAGTGKSHTLKATRTVYEAAGKDVIGLSWTNDVVQQMRGDGFQKAATIASELNALEKGRTSWNKNTVLIVDEAAMVSTGNLARLASAAKQAGAKLILAGDDKQLASIEHGGMFETLRQTHGAAVLAEVQRVKDIEERKAWGRMHEGNFKPQLEKINAAGNLHWTAKQSDTLKQMAERYTADLAADGDKKRFMFVYTNADVASLNQHARALHKERGDLGEDHTIATKTGAAQFATGDRIQFTANGWTQKEKGAGLVNGRVGSIYDIEILESGKARVSVSLDVADDAKAKMVTFVVGENGRAGEFNSFKHGYAGTIYRGQGKTLDQVYVGYSSQWRQSSAYVALTRHREKVEIWAARETVKDLDAMAASMARVENKRAASTYSIDMESAARAGLEAAIADYSTALERPIGASIDRTPAAADRTATAEASPASPAGAVANEVGKVAGGVAAGVGKIAEGVANIAEAAVESLAEGFASLLGGGSSAPAEPRQQAPQPVQPPPPPPQTHAERVKAYMELERQAHAAKLAEIARSFGAGESISEDELRRREMEEQAKSRDRGGGQSR